jgi:hypothetical protein
MTPQLNVKPSKKKAGLSEGAVTGLNLGDLGSAEVLTIATINVDPEYQRDLRHSLVNRIGRQYDIVKAGAILCNERTEEDGGGLWCVDGQHRMAGAVQAGEKEIFAHVTHGLSVEQEAELRLARNDRMPDSVYEKFRTRLVMGDPKAERMLEIVEKHGTTINTAPQGSSGINAVAAVEALYDAGDGVGEWLDRVLSVLTEAYGENRGPEVLSSNLMKATAWFIAQHFAFGEASHADLIERLNMFGPDDIKRKAIAHKAAMGGSDWVNYYRALVELYNFRRTDAKKLKWKTVGSISQLGTYGKANRGERAQGN